MSVSPPASDQNASACGSRYADVLAATALRTPSAALPNPEARRKLRSLHGLAILTLLVMGVYLTWRITCTLPHTGLWLALPFLVLELHAAFSFVLFLRSTWRVDPPPIPDSTQVNLSVAVLIPTYNEDLEVLLPTVAAALALDRPHQTWILDDGDRPEVGQMAQALGAHYLTREIHDHAKAGNLNHALAHLDVDLIAVFDADHVPKPDFLTRTLGYFRDEQVGLVQTPQEFYNTDSFEHLGDGRPVHEETLFYRVIQAGKNYSGAAFWCGTNAVLRVEALREVGGVATDSLTEDLHTTLRLHRAGWKSVYHNEVLARGLAAASPGQYLSQRLRWGRGAMQVLRQERPLTSAGLTGSQRAAYAYSLLAWFDSWRTLGLALIPPLMLCTGVAPLSAPPLLFAVGAGATFGLQQLCLHAFGRGRNHLWLALMFDYIRLPANLLATLSFFFPTPSGFGVTPKGRTGQHRTRSTVPWLLSGLSLGLVMALAWSAATWAGLTPLHYSSPAAVLVSQTWLILTLLLLLAAISRIRQVRFGVERRDGVRFQLQASAYLQDHIPAQLSDISLGGAQVISSGDGHAVGTLVPVDIHFPGHAPSLRLEAVVRSRQGSAHRMEFLPGQWASLASFARIALGPGSN